MKYEKIKTENQNNLQKILTFQAFLAYNTNQWGTIRRNLLKDEQQL